jgi:glutamine synthetase
MFTNPDEVAAYIRDNDVEYVDVRFCDLPGVMQHFTIPASTFGEDTFSDGLGFDGSSIRGFQAINESDMLLLPDANSAFLDPFRRHKTLNVNFFIHDPITREAYSRDPRNVAKKAEAYLAASGIADTAYFGPEAEFYVFDSVRHNTAINESDLRSTMMTNLTNAGLELERGHHEVGTGGQAEINYKFDTLLRSADSLMLFKYIIKNTAWAEGKTATFMPKPLFGDNGSGMHCHQSLWKDGEPLFHAETGYAGLSDTARHYIGGLLAHAPSLLAFTNPTVNSYHRLVPGYEAPINLVYSARNRSACCRIPISGDNPKAKRIEFRVPDPSANPYLAFSAMMMAGLDGVKNKIEPPAPVDKDLYELPPEEALNIEKVPASLDAVLDRLETDHEYLIDGGVFTPDLIETWIEYKREFEIDPIRLRPHPHEFAMYYDI